MKRKTLSNKTRFEIFKRDKFTCQYCGKSAPDVILHVDHINPVFNGGNNDYLNLITSCRDCNMGKNKNLLSDNSVVKKQQSQLKELQERKEQIEFMLKWREGLLDIEDDLTTKVSKKIISLTGCGINEDGKKQIKKWVKEFNIVDLFDSIEISFNQYYGDENNFGKFFYSIPKIANMRAVQKDKPYLADIFKIRAGLSYKMNFFDKFGAKELLEKAYNNCINSNISHEETITLLKKIANKNNVYEYWVEEMEELI